MAGERVVQPMRWRDTDHTYKSGIFTYNGKSVVIEDEGLHRKAQRRIRRDRRPVLSAPSRDENAVQSVEETRPSSQNFKRDVVDVMELMEIKNIKSYRKLYDPNIVRKLERIKAVGGYGKSTERSPPTSPAKSAAPRNNSVKTEINLARQSLVDFKKERNVLEKEIESGVIPEEVALAARPKTAPATTTSPSDASKDDVNKTADAANSNDATETVDATNSNDANNTADAANSNDNSNQMLEDALKRIEKLELEVVQWKRAAKDAASVSIAQSIAKLTKQSQSSTIDDIVEADLQRQALAQKKRKKVIVGKIDTRRGKIQGIADPVPTPSSSNPRKKPRTSEKESEISPTEPSGTEPSSTPLLRSFDIVEISQLMRKDGIKFSAGIADNQASQTSGESTFSEFDIVDSVLEDVVGKVVVRDGGIDAFDIVEKVVAAVPDKR